MKNRHIRAVTGHKSDASLESHNDRPTFEQFQDMSSAITEFVNLSKPQIAVRPVLASRLGKYSATIHLDFKE